MSVAEIAPRGEEFERTPPHDLAAEQCVLGGMLMSKDAISDVLEVIRPGDHYRPAHQIVHEVILDLYGRGEPADAGHGGERADQAGRDRPGGRGAVPAHAHRLRAHRGERRLLRPHRAGAGDPAPAGGGRHPHRPARLLGRRGCRRDRRPGGSRGVRGHRPAGQRGLPVAVGDHARRARRDRGHRQPGRGADRRADRVRRPRRADQRPAPRPDDRHRCPTRSWARRLALDTPLPTPTGWTTMGEVQVGDRLLGADGRPTSVVAATEVMHGRPCYEVEFSNGEVIVADGQHQWLTWARPPRQDASRGRAGPTRDREGGHHGADRGDAVTGGRRTVGRATRCRRAASLDLPEADLPIPPYALGVWLGDPNERQRAVHHRGPGDRHAGRGRRRCDPGAAPSRRGGWGQAHSRVLSARERARSGGRCWPASSTPTGPWPARRHPPGA